MHKPNILSFTRDETPKPSINRERHVNRQMAISVDSPKEFQFKHVKVEDILFIKPSDAAIQQDLQYKRIKWYGKAVNLQHDLQITLRPNLSQLQDKKVNESIQESEDRIIRLRSTKCRFNDKISNRSYELDLNGRYLDQKCAFQENYTLYSKQSFKLKTGMFEQFKNAQLLQKRGNQYEYLLQKPKPTYYNDSKQKSYRTSKNKPNLLNQTDNTIATLIDTPIKYQNELNLKIARNQILQSLEQQKRKRAISEN
ncbi:unnamed protein product [Paramecium pentaurelia]|uniref:Uncharacterized protein n=1 Tax=Paramecium pentaurelia TaxID=43138 RepID=A0A8S1TPK9_9CILI|nr:unnamed protein product [Paramecium pentaurelia]